MTPADATRRFAALPAAVSAAIAGGLDQAAEAVAADARRRLGSIGPSQPGAPPADPSGRLAGAVSAGRDADGQAVVRVDAPYAADLEYGTRCMAARPFLRPAAAATAEAAGERLAEAVARAIAAAVGAGP